MKNTKKIISILLSIVMLMSTIAGMSFSAYANDSQIMSLDSFDVIDSIVYTPAEPYEIMENMNGYWNTIDDGTTFFEYYVPGYNVGDILTINYNDGRGSINYIYTIYNEEYNYGHFYKDGIVSEENMTEFEVWQYSNQYEKPWTVGSDNELYVNYFGHKATIPVTIVKNPIDSIEYTPVEPYEFVENTNGYMEKYRDEELEKEVEYFRYYEPWFNEGDMLIVNYNDGRGSVEYIYTYTDDNDGFYENGDESQPCIELDKDSDQYRNPWKPGSDNEFYVEYMGAKAYIPVTIIENPVESISYTPVQPYEIIENTNGYQGYYYDEELEQDVECFYYDEPGFNEGDKLTVNYKDGTSADYYAVYIEDIGRDFFYKNGEVSDENELDLGAGGIGIYTMQYRDLWTVGSDNVYYVRYFGCIDKKYATVLESNVDSISYTPSAPYVFIEGDEDYCYIEPSGESDFYYYYDIRNNGDVLTVNYKDGTTRSYVYSIESRSYVSDSGEEILEKDVIFDSSNQWREHWTVDHDGRYDIYCNGGICSVPVQIISSTPQPPQHTHSYTSSVVANATCITGGTVRYTCACGSTYVTYTNANGHNFGANNKTCSICGAANPNYVAPSKPTPAPTTPVTTPTTDITPVVTPAPVSKPKATTTSKVTAGKKQVKVTVKKVSGVTGYEIQYSTNKKFTKKTTKTVKVKGAKNTNKTIKGLKSKKTYYVRSRTYKIVNGKTVYSSWSAAKTVKTK